MKKIFTITTVLCALLFTGQTRLEAFCGCNTFYGSAEFLYWHTCRADLDYGILSGESSDFFSLPLKGKYLLMEYDWDPGFRVQLGWEAPSECHHLLLRYTYFHPEASEAVRAKEGEVIFLTLAHPVLTAFVDPNFFSTAALGAKGRNELHYDTVDFLFGHQFESCGCEFMRALLGVRYARCDQRYKVVYRDLFQGVDLETGDSLKVSFDYDLWGVGLQGGLEGYTEICNGLGLFATLEGSLLIGNHEAPIKQLFVEQETFAVDMNGAYRFAMPGFQLGVGADWTLACENCLVKMALGYEMVHWFHLPKDERFNNSFFAASEIEVERDILFHGVSLKAEVAF